MDKLDTYLPFRACCDLRQPRSFSNVGGPAGAERAQRFGSPYSGVGFVQTPNHWLNNASFMTPAQYTFGNEGRNDLVGPAFKNVDFTTSKNFPLPKEASLQFRAEFFNVLNHTNYGTPTNSVQSTSLAAFLMRRAPDVKFNLRRKWYFDARISGR
jgi:hypothetical protein